MSDDATPADIPLYNGISFYRDPITGERILSGDIPLLRGIEAQEQDIELLTGVVRGSGVSDITTPPARPTLDLPPPDPSITDVPNYSYSLGVDFQRFRGWVPQFSTIIKEKPGSGGINFTREGTTGTRTFIVPFVLPGRYTYLDYIQALLGFTYVNAKGVVISIPPDVFSTELSYLLCQEATVEPINIAGNERLHDNRVPNWPSLQEMAANGCMFPNYNGLWSPFADGTTTPNPQGPQPLLPRIMHSHVEIACKYAPFDTDETISVSGKSLSLPGISFAFTHPTDPTVNVTDASTRIPHDLSLLFPFEERSINKRQIWNPNFVQIRELIGTVNKTWFMSYAPRTILLLGCEAHRTYAPNGTRTWNLAFKTLFNKNEHVKIWNPKTNRFEYVKDRKTNKFPYEEADHNVINLWV